MSQKIKSAIVLAAGLGKRMHPLTLEVPKPLVKVKGKPLLQYSIDLLEMINIQNIVVNVHYKSGQIIDFINNLNNPKIQISDETSKILDTGGGIKKAMELIDSSETIVINSDVLWEKDQAQILKKMINIFNPEIADALLCVTPLKNTKGYQGEGDFVFLKKQKICRYQSNDKNPFVYCGLQIISHGVLNNVDEDVFSINELWNKSISSARLMGFKTDIDVTHLGTSEIVAQVNNE